MLASSRSEVAITPRINTARIGAVSGIPRQILTLEGAAVLIAATAAYARLGGGWLMFLSLFFLPDLSMFGYLVGPRIGAVTYNIAHNYILPGMLAAIGLVFAQPTAWLVALIWIAHIGLDRMIGAGLKYATAFGDTHLSKGVLTAT